MSFVTRTVERPDLNRGREDGYPGRSWRQRERQSVAEQPRCPTTPKARRRFSNALARAFRKTTAATEDIARISNGDAPAFPAKSSMPDVKTIDGERNLFTSEMNRPNPVASRPSSCDQIHRPDAVTRKSRMPHAEESVINRCPASEKRTRPTH